MKIATLGLRNFRSIPDLEIGMGPVTLLVGRNNTGKSSIIRGAHALQATGTLPPTDVRFGEFNAEITYQLTDVDSKQWGQTFPSQISAKLSVPVDRNAGQQPGTLTLPSGGTVGVTAIEACEPINFIYPFLAARKVAALEETIDQQRSFEVRANMSNLAAKVDRLMDINHPANKTFRSLVNEVIGLKLSAIASGGGKQVGMWVDNTEWIRIEQMGDGVAQMLGLIVELCVAEAKLFLIEELENDIHPEGLKSLLKVIENSPALAVLMSVLGTWLNHAWLRADGVKRLLVIEEAWHVINDPAMASLFEELLKFARGLGLSMVSVAHHLSDIDDTPESAALLKMASTRVVYQQKSSEARATGERLGLPEWAVELIPLLQRGCAVWDVNGAVHVVQHITTPAEAAVCYSDSAMTEAAA